MKIYASDVPQGTKVYVDGQEVKRVFYVDTSRGLVRRYRDGLPLDRWRKRVLSEALRGRIVIEFPEG